MDRLGLYFAVLEASTSKSGRRSWNRDPILFSEKWYLFWYLWHLTHLCSRPRRGDNCRRSTDSAFQYPSLNIWTGFGGFPPTFLTFKRGGILVAPIPRTLIAIHLLVEGGSDVLKIFVDILRMVLAELGNEWLHSCFDYQDHQCPIAR